MGIRLTSNDLAAYELMSRLGSDIKQGFKDRAIAAQDSIDQETINPPAKPQMTQAPVETAEQADAAVAANPIAPQMNVDPNAAGLQMNAQGKRYRLGDAEQDVPFTSDQIARQRLLGKADVAARYDDTAKSAQYLALADKRREFSDQNQIRDILGNGEPGLERIDASRGQSYLDVVGPRVTDAFLRQGKVAEARAWKDFAESEKGRVYADDFAKAQRLVTAGAYEDALPVLQGIYNRDLPDGRSARLTSAGDGRWQADIVDQSGNVVNSKVMTAADLARGSINALSPVKMVEFMAQQTAKRDTDVATLNRQIQLEDLRQRGQDMRDDRRDNRVQMRLDAQDKMLSRRLDAMADGRITTAQQQKNDSIDAAREQLSGLSQEDVLRKIQSTTATGRTNPEYDPQLARTVRLANTRKFGDDESHDRYSRGRAEGNRQAAGESFAGKPVSDLSDEQLTAYSRGAGASGRAKIDAEQARRTLARMPGLEGHQIGQLVEGKGYQVLDGQGRVVSYLRRKP